HLAVLQQEADDVGGGAVQLRRELLRRDATLDDDRAFGHRCIRRGVRGREVRLHLVEVTTTTSTTLLARGTALAARPATGAARPTGTAGAGPTGTAGTTGSTGT